MRKFAIIPYQEFMRDYEGVKKDNSHTTPPPPNREIPNSLVKTAMSDCGSQIYGETTSKDKDNDGRDNLMSPGESTKTEFRESGKHYDDVSHAQISHSKSSPGANPNQLPNHAVIKPRAEDGEIPGPSSHPVPTQTSAVSQTAGDLSNDIKEGSRSKVAKPKPQVKSKPQQIKSKTHQSSGGVDSKQQAGESGVEKSATITRSGRVSKPGPRSDNEIYWLSG